MFKKYAIIGGDPRIVNLAKMLAEDENDVYTYGIEKAEQVIKNSKLVSCDNLKDVISKAKIIISSIPFSKDGKEIYAPFSANAIDVQEFAKQIDNKIFFAGSIPEIFYSLASSSNKIIDLMKEEDLTILNTIATAEGAIKETIVNTSYNIHGSNVLVLGFGRVAKVVALKFKALDARVTCAARKDKDFAWMETLGLEQTNINKLGQNLNEYDIIINTVPHLILDKNKLQYISKDCFIIDLASKPGGVDEKTCKEQNINFVWALAIPGKVAPITSAKYIKNTIYNILKKGEIN